MCLVLAHARHERCNNDVDTRQNNGENKQHNIRLSVCLSTILEFHNKWLLFLGNYCIRVMKISSKCYKSLQMLRSSGNRHTHKLTTMTITLRLRSG